MSTSNTNNIDSQKSSIRRELGALWSRQASSGSQYLTGKFRLKDIKADFDEVKIIVFPNNKKKSDGSPDYQIFLERNQYENLTGNSTSKPVSQDRATNSSDKASNQLIGAVSEVDQNDLI